MHWILISIAISALSSECSSDSVLYPAARGSDPLRSKRCTYVRTHGMLGVDCNDLNLSEIPPNLRSSIEVLDATYNRIREIRNDSFESYQYLKILYLTDNSISHIEAGAFQYLTDLEILDLTLNSLHFIPEALDSLTSLRKLMLGSNPFVEVTFNTLLPSVQYLSLSSCRLKKFPDFTQLPGLMQLNISDNRIQSIEISQVAPMCSLKLLDLRKNPRLFRREQCNCHLLAGWFTNMTRDGFHLLPPLDDFCKNTTEGLQLIEDPEICFSNETDLILERGLAVRRSCEVEVMKYGAGPLRLKAGARWVIIVLASLSIILVCAFCLYYIRKQSMKSSRSHSNVRLTQSKSRS